MLRLSCVCQERDFWVEKNGEKKSGVKWWALWDLNPRPTGYEPDALTN